MVLKGPTLACCKRAALPERVEAPPGRQTGLRSSYSPPGSSDWLASYSPCLQDSSATMRWRGALGASMPPPVDARSCRSQPGDRGSGGRLHQPLPRAWVMLDGALPAQVGGCGPSRPLKPGESSREKLRWPLQPLPPPRPAADASAGPAAAPARPQRAVW